MGKPADMVTRRWRRRAHKAFDNLWRPLGNKSRKTKRESQDSYQKVHEARQNAYLWLSVMLDIPISECHIAEFDQEICQRVIEICSDVSHYVVADWINDLSEHEKPHYRQARKS